MSFHPAIGRWVQTDPEPYVDGLNLYEGYRSSPTTLLDAMGTSATTQPAAPRLNIVNAKEPMLRSKGDGDPHVHLWFYVDWEVERQQKGQDVYEIVQHVTSKGEMWSTKIGGTWPLGGLNFYESWEVRPDGNIVLYPKNSGGKGVAGRTDAFWQDIGNLQCTYGYLFIQGQAKLIKRDAPGTPIIAWNDPTRVPASHSAASSAIRPKAWTDDNTITHWVFFQWYHDRGATGAVKSWYRLEWSDGHKPHLKEGTLSL